MLRIFEINNCVNGSTGMIMKSLKEYSENRGDICLTASRKDYSKLELAPNNHIYIGGIISKRISNYLSYITGWEGKYSYLSTQILINRIKKFNPNVVHLHNIHGNYININVLFKYLKHNNQIKVIWTLHDCWPLTGHCTFVEPEICKKWMTGCSNCNSYNDYPCSERDNSEQMYQFKEKHFRGLKNMTIVSPSKWLAELVKSSFLSEYSIRVINNGVDLNIFKSNNIGKFKNKYGICGKMLLGVASSWSDKKGINVFIKLAKDLPPTYSIVLIGINDVLAKTLPSRIICINHTENQNELADAYTDAEIFVNPTLEDNYPTVNLEALSCGTPVITYNSGGAGEMITENCGIVVPKGKYDKLKDEILNFKGKKYYHDLIEKTREKYSVEKMCAEYYNLYNG